MPQTVEKGTAELIARYVAVWNEADDGARRRAVEALWSADGAEFLDGLVFRGHDELSDRIERAYEQFVGSDLYTATAADDAARGGAIVAFTIQLVDEEDEAAWAARVFLVLDADDLIREDYHVTVKALAQ
jgi:hypothetical protein